MNLKEIKEMISMMKDNDLTEFELERDTFKIRLSRGNESNTVIERYAQPQQNMNYIPRQQEMQPAITPEIVAPASTSVEIKAPMVGTFYRSPSPDAAPFINVGASVEIGQVICIIEAMKLMNEIKAEVKGKVKAINVENADPIEFGQVLFVIEPN